MSAEQVQAEHISSKEEARALVNVRQAHKDAEDEILDMLVSSGALLKGHFALESGQHSTYFLRFDYVVGSRKSLERSADRLMEDLKRHRVSFDAVLTQEHAGRALGETIADKSGKRILVMETDDRNLATGEIINGTSLYPGDLVLVVMDLVTTGSGLRRMIKSVREKKATPVAIALFATRNKQEVAKFEKEEDLKVYALADLAFERETVVPAKCEGCQAGKVLIPSWET